VCEPRSTRLCPLSEKDSRAAVFDDAKIGAATAQGWELSDAFLQRELDLVWEEAASDLAGEARRFHLNGRAGRTG
jgi:hypothetical protein